MDDIKDTMVTVDGRAGGPGAPIGRRVMLGMLGLSAVGVAAGSRVESVFGGALSSFGRSLGPLGDLVPGNERFRLYAVTGSYPVITEARYRLRIDGFVDRPLSLSFVDLKALPAVEFVPFFQCVTGWRVPGVHWTGVRLASLLSIAGAQKRATALRLFSYDGAYTESLSIEEAHLPDVLVAYRMLDSPITSGHGGPVRLYVPPMYGYKSIKWLSRIEVTDRITPGYWEVRGYPVGRVDRGEPTVRSQKARVDSREESTAVRFDTVERIVHWLFAGIVLVLLGTGTILYIPALALAVGDRGFVESLHIYVGLALPVPLLIGLAGPWRRVMAADLRRLNRWEPGEWRWFRRSRPDESRPLLGKFNPGQKLNAALLGGALLVMLGTGIVMRWSPKPFPLFAATGATFVHDSGFLLIAILVLGHVAMALAHPGALKSMLTGRTPRSAPPTREGAKP